ncbi:MAG: S-methyl-5'-thioadenosine phosphorylase, partial [Chloroflexi bacterium]|nr:S-methyl-5'-thioadenosine phosphorylase [Chloroflexota bacterium]
GLYHVDMSCPYSLSLIKQIVVCAHAAGIKISVGGIYAVTQGPRFETPSEVRMLAMLGGTVVGMTGAPEVFLAAEAGMEYAAICVISNLGCGLTNKKITLEDIQKQMQKSTFEVQQILTIVAEKL